MARRERARDDYDRTHRLMADLGGSLPPASEREPDAFEITVAHALHANQSKNPPAGHGYPKKG